MQLKADEIKSLTAEDINRLNMLSTPMFGVKESDEIYAKNVMPKLEYKYNEGMYINELLEYINNTYSQHYSQNRFQATEFIIDSGHGTGFCMGNVMKYAQRYGKKGSTSDSRKDLLKVIHYAIMQLYVHDTKKESK